MEYIEDLKKDPLNVLEKMDNDKIDRIIKYTSHKYYNTHKPIISDELFDIIYQTMKTRNPNYNNIGVKIEKQNQESKLPIWLGSQNKMKPNTNELYKYISSYKGPYILSDKLDGLSGLLEYKNGNINLYTRGDGNYGKIITELIEYINIPKNVDNILVRGELVISKNNFLLFKDEFNNERNLVSGIVNSKTNNNDAIHYLDFIAYQLIDLNNEIILPINELELLKDYGFKVVEYKLIEELTNNLLSEYLLERRENSPYLIDGIIVNDNNHYPIISHGNPKYSMAFKMVLKDQIAESVVTDVIWSPSKTGYLKPRVRIEPVYLSVKIEYLTGFNANYIKSNNIGIGSIIEIKHSGDVIPHIEKVIKSTKAKMPDVSYHWNETLIDIILDDMEENMDVVIKQWSFFLNTMNIKGISLGIYKKLYQFGCRTIKDILNLNINDLVSIDTIQYKMATNIRNELDKINKQMTLLNLMVGSGKFGRGIGKNKIELILENYPNIIDIYHNDIKEATNKILLLNGFSNKTTSQFISNIPLFMNFIKDNNLKLIQSTNNKQNVESEIKSKLLNKKIVFSGIRDKELEIFIKNQGGTVLNNINHDTFILVVKNKEKKTNKILQCEKNYIDILTIEEFTQLYR